MFFKAGVLIANTTLCCTAPISSLVSLGFSSVHSNDIAAGWPISATTRCWTATLHSNTLRSTCTEANRLGRLGLCTRTDVLLDRAPYWATDRSLRYLCLYAPGYCGSIPQHSQFARGSALPRSDWGVLPQTPIGTKASLNQYHMQPHCAAAAAQSQR